MITAGGLSATLNTSVTHLQANIDYRLTCDRWTPIPYNPQEVDACIHCKADNPGCPFQTVLAASKENKANDMPQEFMHDVCHRGYARGCLTLSSWLEVWFSSYRLSKPGMLPRSMHGQRQVHIHTYWHIMHYNGNICMMMSAKWRLGCTWVDSKPFGPDQTRLRQMLRQWRSKEKQWAITLIVSPWLRTSSAPAGSSVRAHGLTTAKGTPLCRTSSSPCKATLHMFMPSFVTLDLGSMKLINTCRLQYHPYQRWLWFVVFHPVARLTHCRQA